MKLRKQVARCDGEYDWELEFFSGHLKLRCLFTFSDDLETVHVDKEKSATYQAYRAYKNDSTDEVYYDWYLTAGKASDLEGVDMAAAVNDDEDFLDDDAWSIINQVANIHFIAKSRDKWNEFVDPDGHTTDEEWESGTVADRILLMDKCGMLEVNEEVGA
jgi:hypothetical protein